MRDGSRQLTRPPVDRPESDAIARVAGRLRQQFPELPADAIEDVVRGRYEALDGRPVRDFVPVLVERGACAELGAGQRPTAMDAIDLAHSGPLQAPTGSTNESHH